MATLAHSHVVPVSHVDGSESVAVVFNSVLSPEQLQGLRRLAERRASRRTPDDYGIAMYSDPKTSNSGGQMCARFQSWPPRLRGRVDTLHTTLKFGGRYERGFHQRKGGQFRATFAYGEDKDPGIAALMDHEGFKAAARAVYHNERPLIDPQIMFANFMVPGEHQGIHTDVPEFRGANRTNTPEWLLVCMHHSGLFARWRMPICTAVVWVSDHEGGELVFYPKLEHMGVVHPTHANTALLLDTDNVFHGVDPVGSRDIPSPVVSKSCILQYVGAGRWAVATPEVDEAQRSLVQGFDRLSWSSLRMSIQWKAYCWRDEQERRIALEEHSDDLHPEDAYEMLLRELLRRRRARGDEEMRTDDPELACAALCEEFIKVPFELRAPHRERSAAAARL
eukprot:gnl/TRDRNA2_/TRDRNA2_133883_c0_seq2.p1 gnl/TRDRNA2_/TRDRNA2_133883_c0~~gnl/TRDRNA2_/TRDRNA2_133883_c0_seq2.p1  ORF type:complete len:412 (+),score=56.04 gnl/TRDRNA2_/TRDRNA2_133883_c0_seq2:59-1237(+)